MTAPTTTTLRHPIAKGWLVHIFTALGAVCGMLGIIAVADSQPREATLWLAVAMVLDGGRGAARRGGRAPGAPAPWASAASTGARPEPGRSASTCHASTGTRST